ncbi:MAG TPA: 3-hydroxyacyl-CoA dehydrogenase family protein [Cyclobacteriaceae bacterium]|nr:3-hydroxyacyl-CoA dehydrogenase family protein [Cyclobacteriaceae bacterium]
MNILVIGDEINRAECQQKFGTGHIWHHVLNRKDATVALSTSEVVFDFLLDHSADSMLIYKGKINLKVFLNTSLITLQSLLKTADSSSYFFGFCGLPTFLNRDLLEVSILKESGLLFLDEICKKLNTKYARVADSVGLVTPRIICMIINEAYYTVEEGTATRADVDLAMKLGTNYPYGPFEWGQKIGLGNVYDLLTAVHAATQDERYLICPMLKQEAGR